VRTLRRVAVILLQSQDDPQVLAQVPVGLEFHEMAGVAELVRDLPDGNLVAALRVHEPPFVERPLRRRLDVDLDRVNEVPVREEVRECDAVRVDIADLRDAPEREPNLLAVLVIHHLAVRRHRLLEYLAILRLADLDRRGRRLRRGRGTRFLPPPGAGREGEGENGGKNEICGAFHDAGEKGEVRKVWRSSAGIASAFLVSTLPFPQRVHYNEWTFPSATMTRHREPVYGSPQHPMSPEDADDVRAFRKGFHEEGEIGIEPIIASTSKLSVAQIEKIIRAPEDLNAPTDETLTPDEQEAVDKDLDTLGAELGLTEEDFDDADVVPGNIEDDGEETGWRKAA